MRLLSDFTDYYDTVFDGEGEELKRYDNRGTSFPVSMWEIIRLLNIHNTVPLYGYPYSLFEDLKQDSKVIVYTHPYYKHTKEVTLEEADRDFPNCLTVQKVENNDNRILCYRLLHIGRHILWLHYSIDGTCGISKPLTKNDEKDEYSCFKMYSIDYIKNKQDNCIYAINLDTSPLLKGSPVEQLLKAEDIIELLKST